MWVYDTRQDSFVAPIAYPANCLPTVLMYCPANRCLLTNLWTSGFGSTDQLVVIDCASNQIVEMVQVGQNPRPRSGSWDPVHNRVFVPLEDQSSLAVLRVTPSGFEVERGGSVGVKGAGSFRPTILRGPELVRLDCRVLDIQGRDVTDRRELSLIHI